MLWLAPCDEVNTVHLAAAAADKRPGSAMRRHGERSQSQVWSF